LNKVKSPGPKDDTCQIAMHLKQWFMISFFKDLHKYPPFWPPNGPALWLEQIWIPIP